MYKIDTFNTREEKSAVYVAIGHKLPLCNMSENPGSAEIPCILLSTIAIIKVTSTKYIHC